MKRKQKSGLRRQGEIGNSTLADDLRESRIRAGIKTGLIAGSKANVVTISQRLILA